MSLTHPFFTSTQAKSLPIVLFLLISGLVGCRPPGLPGVNTTNIAEVSQSQADRREVYLQGRVIDSVVLLDNGAYQLQDNTGEIWVITQEELPDQGNEVVIRGQVEQGQIPVGTLDIGEAYIVELEQLQR